MSAVQQRFEVLLTTEGWIAQAHCDCGTTRTSYPQASPTTAVERCNESLVEHIVAMMHAGNGSRCGAENQNSVACGCTECKAHDRRLAVLIGPKVPA